MNQALENSSAKNNPASAPTAALSVAPGTAQELAQADASPSQTPGHSLSKKSKVASSKQTKRTSSSSAVITQVGGDVCIKLETGDKFNRLDRSNTAYAFPVLGPLLSGLSSNQFDLLGRIVFYTFEGIYDHLLQVEESKQDYVIGQIGSMISTAFGYAFNQPLALRGSFIRTLKIDLYVTQIWKESQVNPISPKTKAHYLEMGIQCVRRCIDEYLQVEGSTTESLYVRDRRDGFNEFLRPAMLKAVTEYSAPPQDVVVNPPAGSKIESRKTSKLMMTIWKTYLEHMKTVFERVWEYVLQRRETEFFFVLTFVPDGEKENARLEKVV